MRELWDRMGVDRSEQTYFFLLVATDLTIFIQGFFFNHGNNNFLKVYLIACKPDIPITCDLTGVEMY